MSLDEREPKILQLLPATGWGALITTVSAEGRRYLLWQPLVAWALVEDEASPSGRHLLPMWARGSVEPAILRDSVSPGFGEHEALVEIMHIRQWNAERYDSQRLNARAETALMKKESIIDDRRWSIA